MQDWPECFGNLDETGSPDLVSFGRFVGRTGSRYGTVVVGKAPQSSCQSVERDPNRNPQVTRRQREILSLNTGYWTVVGRTA